MSITDLLRWIIAAGALGGLVNAVLADNTFGIPKKVPSAPAAAPPPPAAAPAAPGAVAPYAPSIAGWVLAGVANIILGAAASFLSWAMYGPLAGCPLIGEQPTPCQHPELTLTLSVLGTAIVVGVAGPRWITNEVDKKLLKDAAAQAMAKPPNPGVAQRMTMAGPAEVLSLVKNA